MTINKHEIFIKAREASSFFRNTSENLRVNLIKKIGERLLDRKDEIIAENIKDQENLSDSDPKKDRLILNEQRIEEMAKTAIEISNMSEPIGKIQLTKKLEAGFELQKITAPLGVVGVIYESRPNVTVDIALLCLRSGNVAILKGGKEADFSNRILVDIIHEVLNKLNITQNCIQLLPTERVYTQMLLEADNYVDIIIPRGSANLIEYVRKNSKVPTIETGAGVCHTFVEKTADLKMAAEIVINAKLQRPSVCNALDTIILDNEIAEAFMPLIISEFSKLKVEIYADPTSYKILYDCGYKYLQKASPEDFGREYLGYSCSIIVLNGIDEAMNHIENHSSRHSECIVTQEKILAEKFIQSVDAAAVYHNVSTRFTDGGQFGLGAEIGISTQKLHARGPFGMEKLVTEKWIGRGTGQIRK